MRLMPTPQPINIRWPMPPSCVSRASPQVRGTLLPTAVWKVPCGSLSGCQSRGAALRSAARRLSQRTCGRHARRQPWPPLVPSQFACVPCPLLLSFVQWRCRWMAQSTTWPPARCSAGERGQKAVGNPAWQCLSTLSRTRHRGCAAHPDPGCCGAPLHPPPAPTPACSLHPMARRLTRHTKRYPHAGAPRTRWCARCWAG